MFLYYTRSGRSRPGAALAARVEGGVVGEALADAVASAVGRRGAVGAAPAGVAREASAGVRGSRRRASERRRPRCGGRAAAQAVGVERRVVRIALANVVGAAPRRRGALVVVAAAGVAHEAHRGCRGGRGAWRRLAGRGRRLGRGRWFGRALLFWVPRAPAVVGEGFGRPFVAVLVERRDFHPIDDYFR